MKGAAKTLAGAILFAAASAAFFPAQAAPAGQAQIDQAIKAYQLKQDSAASAARDQRAAGKIDALENNPGSPALGNPKGDVTIVEFFDYACPFCKAAEPRLMAVVKADHRVKLVLKEFPILTPQSLTASRMALAAARQGKYEAFHLTLMRANGQLEDAGIAAAAKTAGLDMARARKDMYAPEVTDEIIANFNLARAIRAFQTPTYIVGGHILTEDSADIDFPKTVAAARAKRK